MEIPFQGQLDERILRRVSLMSVRPSGVRLIFLCLAVSLILWGSVLYPARPENFSAGVREGLLTWGPVLLVVCGYLFVKLVLFPKMHLQANKLAQGSRTGTVNDEGIHLETLYSKADLPWNVFLSARIEKGRRPCRLCGPLCP
jgi:hypothetical protein